MTALYSDHLPYGCLNPFPDVGQGLPLGTDKMLFCGGSDTESNVCYIHQLGKQVYLAHPTNMLYPRMEHAMVEIDEKIWISGGQSSGSGTGPVMGSF